MAVKKVSDTFSSASKKPLATHGVGSTNAIMPHGCKRLLSKLCFPFSTPAFLPRQPILRPMRVPRITSEFRNVAFLRKTDVFALDSTLANWGKCTNANLSAD
jgi:hypothetical protein